MTSSLFWNFTQRYISAERQAFRDKLLLPSGMLRSSLIATDVEGQDIGPIFKGQDGNDRQSVSRLRKPQISSA